MDDKILDKLVLNVQESWLAVKETIGCQLLGDPEPLMVPHLEDAQQYSLYRVFVKLPRKNIDKIRNRPKTVACAGDLKDLLRKNHKEEFHDMVLRPTKVKKKYNADYEFLASDLRAGGVKRSVTVKLPNCEYIRVDPLQMGKSLQIDVASLGLGDPKSIYIIQEVWTTKGYNLQVGIGDRAAESFSTVTTPVAFTYKKYPLLPGGFLGIQKKPANMRKARSYVWLRKSEFRLANDPLPEISTGPVKPSDITRRQPTDQLPPLPAVPSDERLTMPLPPVPEQDSEERITAPSN